MSTLDAVARWPTGSCGQVAPGLRAATLEAKVAEHPAGRTAAGLREDAASLPAALARAAREQATLLS